MTEEQMQAECFQWHWNEYIEERRMLFHVQNNSHSKRTGSKRKAVGVVSGVADMVIITPGRVTFIELKVGANRQSDEQKDFQIKLIERGVCYYVIRSIEDFKHLVKSLYEQK